MDSESLRKTIEALRRTTVVNEEARRALRKFLSSRMAPERPDAVTWLSKELDEMSGRVIASSGQADKLLELYPELERLNQKVTSYTSDEDAVLALPADRRNALALIVMEVGQLLTTTAYLSIAAQERLLAEQDYLIQLRSYARKQRSLGLAAGIAGLVVCLAMLFYLAQNSSSVWDSLSNLLTSTTLVAPAVAQTALPIPDREQTRTLAVFLFSLVFTVFFLFTIPVAYFAKDIERRAMAADFLKAAFSFLTGTLLGFFAGS